MSDKDNFSTALVHELCPYCLTKMNEQIILPKILSKKISTEITNMHGKAIGFSDSPCEHCQANLDNHYVYLIGIDAEKSASYSLKDVYRIGKEVWLKQDVFEKIFTDTDLTALPHKLIFVEEEVFDKIGISFPS